MLHSYSSSRRRLSLRATIGSAAISPLSLRDCFVAALLAMTPQGFLPRGFRRQDGVLVLAGHFGRGLFPALHLRRVFDDHLVIAAAGRDHRVAVLVGVHLKIHDHRLVYLPRLLYAPGPLAHFPRPRPHPL